MFDNIKAMIRDRSWLFSLLGKIVLYAFPPLGVLGFIALLALREYEYLILGTYILLPVIVAPLAYGLVRKKGESAQAPGDDSFVLLVAGYLLCFAFSITLLYAFDVRPLIYYAVVAVMATIVLLQILRSKITPGRTAVVLLQVILLALNLCWGITLKYFMYIGRTDILAHTYYTDSLVQLGHVTSVFYDYQPFPLWHILNAAIYLVGGPEFPTYKVMAIAGGLAFATLPVLIYLISLRLFGNERTALIAALATAFFPDIVAMSASTIPRVIAEILMVFIVYLLLAGRSKSRSKYLLIVPMTVAIIIYHSISILFVVVILGAVYVMQLLFVKKEERFVSLWYLAFSLAATGLYWMLNANIIIERLISNASAATDAIDVPAALSGNSPWNELFNYLQYVPSILFILAGFLLLMFVKGFSSRARIFGLAALGFVWLSFPGPLDMMGQLVQNLGIDRFAEYTFLILILVAAVGVAGLYYRSGRVGRTAIVAVFMIWVLLAVSSDWVASDNPLVKRPFYTFDFSGQEITGMDRLAVHTTGILMSDYVPNRYYESSPYEEETTILQVDAPNQTFLRHNPTDVFLVRSGEQSQRDLRTAVMPDDVFVSKPEGDMFGYVDTNASVWGTLANDDRIYDSRAIQAYT